MRFILDLVVVNKQYPCLLLLYFTSMLNNKNLFKNNSNIFFFLIRIYGIIQIELLKKIIFFLLFSYFNLNFQND